MHHFSLTGYFAKKLVNYESVVLQGSFQDQAYPWPLIRLVDLYLLYAEAINEAYGPENAYQYIDKVRARAGLKGVVESWEKHSRNPNKPKTKAGLREIIQKERKIELALEGPRFWDQMRWKTAMKELNQPMLGWDVFQSLTISYYRPVTLVQRIFKTRDYFWPIKNSDLGQNDNFVFTKVRYTDINDQEVVLEVSRDEAWIYLDNYKKGTEVIYQTAYRPALLTN